MGSEKFGNKEHVLNFTAQRFQLTRPSAVGPTMDLIRACNPKDITEWEEYYWSNAYTRRSHSEKITPETLEALAERLYDKIKNVVEPEWIDAFKNLTKDDCLAYIHDVTINRSFDGYHREDAVTRILGIHFKNRIKFVESDSKMDSSWGIDWIGEITNTTISIGIQVKPVTSRATAKGGYSVEDRGNSKWAEFKTIYGGPVFVVYSKKKGKKFDIQNLDVISEIELFLDSL
jgi:hypothetical protein